MSQPALPSEDQLVTMVSVRDGNIYVTSARVLVSKPKSLGLRIDTRLSATPAPFERSQPLTLLYAQDERVMRLKAIVSSPIDDERLTIQPVGDIKEGDRRDFRRADLMVGLHLQISDRKTSDEARVAQLARDVSPDAFTQQSINLSGSGIQLSSKVDWDSGTLLDIRLILPLPTATPVCVIGEVVRMLDIEDDDGRRVAVRFAEISEPDQDLIVYTVFSRHFQDEGLSEEFSLQV